MSKLSSRIDLPVPALERGTAVPMHQQIYEHIRAAIVSGRLKPRLRLPATRQLAADWGVSRNVVLLGFEQLLLEGYLVARTGSGTFVADEPSPRTWDRLPAKNTPADLPESKGRKFVPPGCGTAALAKNTSDQSAQNPFRQVAEQFTQRHFSAKVEMRPFQTSVPSLRDFPFNIWNRLAAQVYRGLHVQHVGYGDAAGHWPLRQAIAEHVGVNRAVRCTAEQVVIVQGTQQAVFLAGSLLMQPGDGFLMEDPGYGGALAGFRAAGGVACPVPVGPQGLDIGYALAHHSQARVAYVTPSHQFPMGATLSYHNRKSLLEWAERTGGWIIEDDFDSELRFCGRSLPSLQGMDQAGRVVYVGTFSKTLFPALRIGYLILPDLALAALFTRAKALLDRHGPLVEQLILTKFMQEGHFGRHLRRMQQLYERKQSWLMDALRLVPSLGTLASDMGMNLLLWLPENTDDRDVSTELARRGVSAPALSNYTIVHRQPPALLLGYAAYSQEQMQKGVNALSEVLRDGGET